MTQADPPHRFENDQGNAWCRHCGLSEAVHDLRADQPSRRMKRLGKLLDQTYFPDQPTVHPKLSECEVALNERWGKGWLTSGYRQNGELTQCPCGRWFEHVCDEAEGCSWFEVLL